MELPFWSIHSENGVTSNIAAVAIMGVLESKYNVILAENHYNADNLGERLVFARNTSKVMEEGMYHVSYGNELSDDIVEIINKRLFYIQPFHLRKDCFELNFYNYTLPKIRNGKIKDGIFMIDTDNKGNISSQEILHSSKLVIVNLCQDIMRTQMFVDEYSSIIEKAVFIIGRYKKCRVNKVKKLLELYRVPLDRIAVIPYNDEYNLAMEEGRSVEFISRNHKCRKGTKNYYFINELKKATRMILRHVEEIKKQ